MNERGRGREGEERAKGGKRYTFEINLNPSLFFSLLLVPLRGLMTTQYYSRVYAKRGREDILLT